MKDNSKIDRKVLSDTETTTWFGDKSVGKRGERSSLIMSTKNSLEMKVETVWT